MKNQDLMNSSFGHFIRPDLSLDEFSSCEEYEKYCMIRDEMNKFMLNLDRCWLCKSVHDQIHHLYVALIHLENLERELLASSLTEEMLFQEIVIIDINSLKLMIQDYIHSLSEKINH